MKAKGNKYSWLLAYINSEFVEKVEEQLKKYPEYKKVKAFIPTVKVLKKDFKGKQEFVDVPILFQYGFFKVPRTLAIHPAFLEGLQQDVSCIYGWVKDPAKAYKPVRAGEKIQDNNIPIATISNKDLTKLIRETANLGAHSSDMVESLKPGQFIILHGYPYDGCQAEFISKNDKKKTVKVRLILFNQNVEVDVSFDNVYFSMYQNKAFDDTKVSESGVESLDEMRANKTDGKAFKKMYQKNEAE